MYDNNKLISMLSEVLGFPKKNYGVEVEFNCPFCDNGRNKYNLGVNTDKKLFHCWSCDYRGPVERIFKDRGREDYAVMVNSIQKTVVRRKGKAGGYKESFKSMKFRWKYDLKYLLAKRYLSDRKIDQELIDKWDICYSDTGEYKNRIIIPSISIDGKVEYFVARDFYGDTKLKYKNPPTKKSEVIFGEKFIDWKKTVILTEGVFDAMVLPNAVPMLGSKIDGNTKLIETIINNNTHVIIGFDDDKAGFNGRKQVGSFLESLGVGVYVLPNNKHGDLSSAYQHGGKDYVISLIRQARSFDKLDVAIQELLANG